MPPTGLLPQPVLATCQREAVDGRGGDAADAGSSYRIWSKNENLLAWRDGAPDVMSPDLICCLSGESGEPVANPHHAVGERVDVVGVPAPSQWRASAGVAVLGPRHFGFDLDFVPLEERLPQSPE